MAIPYIDGIQLTQETIWADEFEGWTPVGQTSEIAIDGTLVEEHSALNAGGRPMKIIVPNSTLSTVRALEILRNTQRDIMLLSLVDGREFSVYFNHSGGPFVAEPVQYIPDYSRVDGLQFFKVTLNFMQVL